MSKPISFLLLFVLLSCKKEEFNIYYYDGEYPKKMDGHRIDTFSPEISGGEISIFYNGHAWNHAPFLKLITKERNPPKSVFGVREIEVTVFHSLDAPSVIGGCLVETLNIQCPLKEGKFDLNTLSKVVDHEYNTIFYSTINCDAGKDHYKLNMEKTNFVEIVRFEEGSREIEITVDVNFKMSRRNPNFGPVYPANVNLRGTIKGIVGKGSEPLLQTKSPDQNAGS